MIMSRPLNVILIGSTGSIGAQAIQVAEKYPDRIRLIGLAAHRSSAIIAEQAIALSVDNVVLADEKAAGEARGHFADAGYGHINVETGSDALVDLAQHQDADIVLNAMVGSAGLRVTLAALSAGKILALANKESLVVGGELIRPLLKPGLLRPVDSEHSAIFQCLGGSDTRLVSRLWLTASGGPFRNFTSDQLVGVTAKQALEHPTWKMGPKISIDSATLMNKGLEVIEAYHLFGVDYDSISVIVHPQSLIHSMVEYSDGSILAHLGATDMRIPIQYAFSYPERWEIPCPNIDLTSFDAIELKAPDAETFPCLNLAYAAGRAGGTAPAVLNAANESAVEAFLEGRCGFLDIPSIVAHALEMHDVEPVESIYQIEDIDRQARESASRYIAKLSD